MQKSQLKQFRHPAEASRFWLSLTVVAPILAAAIAVTFATFGAALLGVAAILMLTWIATRLFRASFLGSTVKVSGLNFPEIHQAIAEAKETFGYKGEVEAFVYEDGNFNALIVPLLKRKVLLINSGTISDEVSPNEIRWLVSRFVGSLASKHYRFAWLQIVISSIEKIAMFNLLLYPYERAVVKSGDRLALYAIDGDIESATRAMRRFMVGTSLGHDVSLAGVRHQADEIRGTFFGWLAQCLSSFPHTSTRIVDLLAFAQTQYPAQWEHLNVLDAKASAPLAPTSPPAPTLDPTPPASVTPLPLPQVA